MSLTETDTTQPISQDAARQMLEALYEAEPFLTAINARIQVGLPITEGHVHSIAYAVTAVRAALAAAEGR